MSDEAIFWCCVTGIVIGLMWASRNTSASDKGPATVIILFFLAVVLGIGVNVTTLPTNPFSAMQAGAEVVAPLIAAGVPLLSIGFIAVATFLFRVAYLKSQETPGDARSSVAQSPPPVVPQVQGTGLRQSQASRAPMKERPVIRFTGGRAPIRERLLKLEPDARVVVRRVLEAPPDNRKAAIESLASVPLYAPFADLLASANGDENKRLLLLEVLDDMSTGH